MFCRNCGKMIQEGNVFCIACGTKVEPIKLVQKKEEKKETVVIPKIEENNKDNVSDTNTEYNQTSSNHTVETTPNTIEDKASFWFNVLSFFIPIVGLILFLVTKNERPKRAKGMGICALVGYILSMFTTVIFCIWFYGTVLPRYSTRDYNKYRYTDRYSYYTDRNYN